MTAQSEDDPPPAEAPVTLVENVFAPEVYADEASFFFLKNGNIAITFASGRLEGNEGQPPYPIRRVVVGRLVMPVDGARAMAESLFDFLKSRGFAPNIDVKKAN